MVIGTCPFREDAVAFVPLINRSAFTFYSGTARAERIVEACARWGYTAAGLCDRDGLYTAIPFARAAEKAGLKPVIGTEITSPRSSSPPLFALARTDEGYARLCELVTRRNLQRPAPLPPRLFVTYPTHEWNRRGPPFPCPPGRPVQNPL